MPAPQTAQTGLPVPGTTGAIGAAVIIVGDGVGAIVGDPSQRQISDDSTKPKHTSSVYTPIRASISTVPQVNTLVPNLKSTASGLANAAPGQISQEGEAGASVPSSATGLGVATTGAEVTGDEVAATGAEVTGDEVAATGAEVTGAEVTGDEVAATGAEVTGDEVAATGAEVTGAEVAATGAEVTGAEVAGTSVSSSATGAPVATGAVGATGLNTGAPEICSQPHIEAVTAGTNSH